MASIMLHIFFLSFLVEAVLIFSCLRYSNSFLHCVFNEVPLNSVNCVCSFSNSSVLRSFVKCASSDLPDVHSLSCTISMTCSLNKYILYYKVKSLCIYSFVCLYVHSVLRSPHEPLNAGT